MKKTILNILSVLAVSALVFGCVSKSHLDSAGVYKGDTYLFSIDKTIVNTYLVTDAFLLWETQNNSYIKTNMPEAFTIANVIRANAPVALADVKKARDAYISYFNSPAGNFATISNNLLTEVNSLVAQSQSFATLASSSSISNSFTSILVATTNNPFININTVLSTVSTNN